MVRAIQAARAGGRPLGLVGVAVLAACGGPAVAAPGPPGPLVHRLLAVRAGEPGAKLRVLHLGDSHVAAEPFSLTLRAFLEAIAGGDGGPGLFFPGLPYNATRSRGVDFQLSPGWTRSHGTTPVPAGETGLSGGFVEARRGGETLRAEGAFTVLRVLLLRQPGGGAAWIRIDGRTAGRVDLRGGFPELAVFRWSGPGGARVELETVDSGPVRVLGIAFENGRPGLVYSPAGVVGAQANVLLRCREELFVRQLETDPPDLVVLGFGTNEAREFAFDPVAYAAAVDAVVRRIRKGAPSAMVLLTGPPDQERVTASGTRTVAALAHVTAAQRDVARRSGAAFLDLREAMGGAGTVRRWALSAPALAQPDRVHYTALGYERLARLVAVEVAGALEAERRHVAGTLPASRLAEAAARPVAVPDELPGRARPAARSSRTAAVLAAPGGSGDLRTFRDGAGRLVVTNLEGAPARAPELGRKDAVRR